MKKFLDYWKLLGMITRYWPIVREAVEYVERFNKAKTSEEKKRLAKEFIQDRLPGAPTWCPQDWDAFVGGLIDAVVAFLNWRGIFKHAPGHPCAS